VHCELIASATRAVASHWPRSVNLLRCNQRTTVHAVEHRKGRGNIFGAEITSEIVCNETCYLKQQPPSRAFSESRPKRNIRLHNSQVHGQHRRHPRHCEREQLEADIQLNRRRTCPNFAYKFIAISALTLSFAGNPSAQTNANSTPPRQAEVSHRLGTTTSDIRMTSTTSTPACQYEMRHLPSTN
jgi:hypothetical protein